MSGKWHQYPCRRKLHRTVGCEGRCAAGRLSPYIEGNAAWMLEKARSGGGAMLNLGVHWIDLYRWLLADEVAEVSPRSGRCLVAHGVSRKGVNLREPPSPVGRGCRPCADG
jgi:predicted dehydrogenase